MKSKTLQALTSIQLMSNQSGCQMKAIWDGHFLLIDFLLALGLTLSFFAWINHYNGLAYICPLLAENRPAIYGTLTSTFGSILGFIITSFSIIIGYLSSPRFNFFKKTKHSETLSSLWLQTISILGLATIASLAGLIIDRDDQPFYPILYIVLFLILLSTFRVYSCLKVLGSLVINMSQEASPQTESTADSDLEDYDED